MPLDRMDTKSKSPTQNENKTTNAAETDNSKVVGRDEQPGGMGFGAATKKISYWSTVFSAVSELAEKSLHRFASQPLMPQNALPLAAYYQFGSWMAIGTFFGGVFGYPSALEKIRADLRHGQSPSLKSRLLFAGVTLQTCEGILYFLRMVYKIPMRRVASVGAFADMSKMSHCLLEGKWTDALLYSTLIGAHVSVALELGQHPGQVSHSPRAHWRVLQPLLRKGPRPFLSFGVLLAGAQAARESCSGGQSSDEACVSVEGVFSERESRIVYGNGS